MKTVRAWVLASRPKTLAAAGAPVLAASGLALADMRFALLPATAAFLGALLIQIGTNFANDYYDFVKGSDGVDRVGPLRVTQAGLLSPASVRLGMVVALSLALCIGVYLVSVAGWPIVVIGLASLVCAVGYTGGPFPLAYHGLGDLFVFVFFGLVAVGGTYYVQALLLSPGAVVAGVGVGAFTTAILVVNNLRDRVTDEAAGKRTLAVRLGDRLTVVEYVACLATAASVPVVGTVLMAWSPLSLLSLVGVVASLPALARVFRYPDRPGLNPALGQTARGVALYGLGLGLGHVMGSL